MEYFSGIIFPAIAEIGVCLLHRRLLCLLLCLALVSGFAFSEETVAPTPTATLPAGAYGNGSVDTSYESPIIQLQEKLIDLGLLSGVADGHFGSGTESAVKLFQEMYGLEPTGIADETTQAVLSTAQIGIREVQEKLIALGVMVGEADGIPGEATEKAISLFQIMYGLEETGIANPDTRSLLFTEQNIVLEIQQKLISLSYLSGEADGVLGANTSIAIEEFQQTHNLPATGIADPATRELLLGGTNLMPKPTPTPSPRVNGASGADIEAIQEKLAVWGFLDGNVDGDFGNATEDAVKAFKSYVYAQQQAYYEANPTPTPVPTPSPTPEPTPYVAPGEMPIVIDHTLEPTPSPTPEPTPYEPDDEVDDELLAYFRTGEFAVYRQTVQSGDTGDEVTRVQTRLGQLGYLYNGADGEFGNLTLNALKYFQYRNGLDQDGIADEKTQSILFSSQAVESTEYVFPYKLIIDVSDQRVYVYQWTGTGYDNHIKTFKCSTGTKANPTPIGTWQAAGQAGGRWYYFKDFDCYAQYAYRIFGGILFHSVLYSSANERSLTRSSVRNLGKRASHGCIRLSVDDAKWIYSNCPAGTTVTVRN